MPDQLQLRGGTTAQHASFTGVSKEVTVDTTKKTAVVHDGSTAGGNPLLREDGSNSALALGSQGTPSLKFTGDTNTGIFSPGADQLAISTGGSGRVFIGSTGTVNFTGGGTAGSTQAVSFNGSAPVNSLVIDSSGRLGIGVSSPSTRLHVQDTAGNAQLRLTGNSGYTELYTDGSFYIQPNGSTKMVVQSGGNVGIGTASPNNKLDIAAATANIGIDGTSNTYINFLKSAANIGYVGDANWMFGNSSSDFGLRATSNLVFGIGANEKARLDSSGRLLVGTSSTSSSLPKLIVSGGADGGPTPAILVANSESAPTDGAALGDYSFSAANHSSAARIVARRDGGTWTAGSSQPTRLEFSTTADGASSPTERMRITNNGGVLVGKIASDLNVAGFQISSTGQTDVTVSGSECMNINRNTNDGNLIRFFQDNTFEGSISVSGTTVSYNGAHLSRWSQLPSGAEREEILRGSVLSNINEMCEWDDEENEQLNRMKVSDVEGDKNVSGVFQAWDDDDDTYTNDFYCAMTGDFIIRIAEGVTVERGDLLMSAGDGTAKPQDDDIIRSKTIAKVTSTNVSCTYEDGSYCVPCVLMAC